MTTTEQRCDLCEGADFEALVTGTRFGVEAPIVMCRRCGLTFQHPRPEANALASFYRDEYRTLYCGLEDPSDDFVAEQERRGQVILERVNASRGGPPGRVLDVGCGAGGTLLPFRAAGWTVMGVEPGSFGEWGRRELGLDIRPIADLADLDGAEFDVVVISFVLEHVPSPADVLAHANRLVGPQGRVYVEVPNLATASGAVDEYFHVAHLTYFTPDTLAAALRRAGFDVAALHCGREYSTWAIGAAVREAGTASWDGPPLDTPDAAWGRLRSQQKAEAADKRLRNLVKPAVVVGGRVARALAGDQAERRLRMALRRTWKRLRRRP